MPNNLYLIIKVGDQETALGKEDMGMKDGFPVCIVETSKPDKMFSNHMKKVYSIIEIDRSLKSSVKSWLVATGTVGEDDYRSRVRKIDLDSLETKAGYVGYVTDLRGTKIVSIIDAKTIITENDFISTEIKGDPKPDLNAVSSGSYDIGPGEAYTNITSAYADTANLTANLTFITTGVMTETAAPTVTENLNGFTFKLTSNIDHKGDPTAGHLITFDFAGPNVGCFYSMEGPGTIIHELTSCASIGARVGGFVYCATVTTGFTIKVRNNLFDGRLTNTDAVSIGDADVTLHGHNNKCWDGGKDSGANRGFKITAAHSDSIMENNDVRNFNNGFLLNNLAVTCRNNYVFDCSVTGDFTSQGTATGENNSSDGVGVTNSNWGTGTGNIPSTTPADELSSLTDTDSDYLDINATAPNIKDGGTTVTIAENTAGIEGNARPHGSDFSIGCHELLSIKIPGDALWPPPPRMGSR